MRIKTEYGTYEEFTDKQKYFKRKSALNVLYTYTLALSFKTKKSVRMYMFYDLK